MKLKKLSKYASPIARMGVGVVFLIFGLWQIIDPNSWFGYLPSFVTSFGISLTTILILNGIFDLIIGLSLVSGFYVRLFSALGILHLLVISLSLGFTDVTVRDVGLMIVLVSVFLKGKDEWCLR